MTIKCAISPCPNDVYIYAGLLSGAVAGDYSFHIHPLGQLNELALNTKADILKVSAALFPKLQDRYRLSAVGANFARGEGPKLVTHVDRSGGKFQTILTPSLYSSASMVVARFFPECEQVEADLQEIPNLLSQKKCEAGIVLNEAMTELARYNLRVEYDLAKLWQEKTGAVLPLGVVIIANSVSYDEQEFFEAAVRRSIAWAKANHEEAMKIVLEHASEKDEEVALQHIQKFAWRESSASEIGL